MCTVIIHVAPSGIVLAANRDELLTRPWDPPAEHWPGITGGRDRTAGGTWMALNAAGVTAAVLNRPGTLGPTAGKRSRGELPLLALAHPTAANAAEAMTRLDATQYRGFNMVIADPTGAWFVRGTGHGTPQAHALPDGVSMVTAYDPNDPESPRTARHLPRFQAAAPTFATWQPILADSSGPPGEQINVTPRGGFGTVCSSFLTLPATGIPIWLFAPGAPDQAAFLPVTRP
jgi:hypothetical protein